MNMTDPGTQPYMPPQPAPQPRKRHPVLFALSMISLIVVIGAVAAAMAASAGHPAAALRHGKIWHMRHEHVTAQPVNTAPAVTMVREVTRVLFVVKGSAPDGADITYGSDSDNRSAPGSLGALGTGASVPWHATVPYKKGALYYVVDAQLDGSGDITCTAWAQVTAYYSDGTKHAVKRKIASGHASGGYSICMAEST